MKSWNIIKDAWTGSLLDFVIGVIGTAAFAASLIIIMLLGGSLI